MYAYSIRELLGVGLTSIPSSSGWDSNPKLESQAYTVNLAILTTRQKLSLYSNNKKQ